MNAQQPQPKTTSPVHSLLLDMNGLPILDEVVIADTTAQEMAATIKAQLLQQLEPQLQGIIAEAFTTSIKDIALELKHSFKANLDQVLEQRLENMVTQAVNQACRKSWNDE